MEILGWILACVEAVVIVHLYRKPSVVEKEYVEVVREVEKVIIEPEIPDDIQALAIAADPYVERFDKESQGGEWKFHQVYAAMLKDKALKGSAKHKIGLAIHLALAHRRAEQEEKTTA